MNEDILPEFEDMADSTESANNGLDELGNEPLVYRQAEERKVLPSGYYVGEITAAGQKPNPFYNPETDPENKRKQMEIRITVKHPNEAGEEEEYLLLHWTSLAISDGKGKSKASFLYKLLTAAGLDPADGPLPSDLVGKKLRFNIEKSKKADGTEFNKVLGGKYEAI